MGGMPFRNSKTRPTVSLAARSRPEPSRCRSQRMFNQIANHDAYAAVEYCPQYLARRQHFLKRDRNLSGRRKQFGRLGNSSHNLPSNNTAATDSTARRLWWDRSFAAITSDPTLYDQRGNRLSTVNTNNRSSTRLSSPKPMTPTNKFAMSVRACLHDQIAQSAVGTQHFRRDDHHDS